MLNKESNFFVDVKARQAELDNYNKIENRSSNLNITNDFPVNNRLNLENNAVYIESEIVYTNSSNVNTNKNLETNITIDFENENNINSINKNSNGNSAINNLNYNKNNGNNNNQNNYHYSNLSENDFPNKIRKYGNTFSFLNYGNAPLIVIGPNWPYFLGLTLILFLSFFAVFLSLGNKLNCIVRIIGITLYSIQFISYTACSILNPGLADNRFLENQNFKYDEKQCHPCTECKLLINVNTTEITYHCFECEVCVEGYDHHCPWTTKCIGKKNVWLFYVFVASTFAYMISLFIAISLIQ